MDLGDVTLQGNHETSIVMQIDKRDGKENTTSTLIHWAIFASILFVTFYNNKQSLVNVMDASIGYDDQYRAVMTAVNITPYNLFFMVECYLLSSASDAEKTRNVNISIVAKSPSESSNVVFATERQHEYHFSGKMSSPATVFYDKLLYRSSYEIEIGIGSNSGSKLIEDVKLVATLGNPVIASMILLVRIYGCVIMFGYVIVFAYTVLYKYKKQCYITTEQKITLCLTIICGLADDPMEGVYLKQPSMLLIVMRVVCTSVLRILIRYYITLLFDSVRCQRKATNGWRNVIIAVFFSIICGFDIASSLTHENSMYKTKIAESDRSTLTTKYICELVTDGFDLIYIVLAMLTLDITEQFRFNVYTIHSLSFLVISSSCSMLRVTKPRNDMNTLLIMMELLSVNIFVSLMNNCHWPVTQVKNEYETQGTDPAMAEGLEFGNDVQEVVISENEEEEEREL